MYQGRPYAVVPNQGYRGIRGGPLQNKRFMKNAKNGYVCDTGKRGQNDMYSFLNITRKPDCEGNVVMSASVKEIEDQLRGMNRRRYFSLRRRRKRKSKKKKSRRKRKKSSIRRKKRSRRMVSNNV